MKGFIFSLFAVLAASLLLYFAWTKAQRRVSVFTCGGFAQVTSEALAASVIVDHEALCRQFQSGFDQWNAVMPARACTPEGWTIRLMACHPQCIETWKNPASRCFGPPYCLNGETRGSSKLVLIGAGPPPGDARHEALHVCYSEQLDVRHTVDVQHAFMKAQGLQL